MIIGKKLGIAEQQKISGGSQFVGFWQKNRESAGKWLSFQDTGASAGNNRANNIPSSFYVSWAEREEAIAIDNEIIKSAKSPHDVLPVVETAVKNAVSAQLDVFGTAVYTGTPSSYSTDKWDIIVGLDEWIHNSNNLCGVDRSSAANANFRAQYSTGALSLSLDLIDQIVVEGVAQAGGGTTTPLINYGSKGDIVILPNAGYRKLKAEAIARQAGRVVTSDQLPKGGMVGYLNEYIDYNGRMIVPDPKAAASSMYILDSDTWTLQFRGGDNFRVTPFVDLREQRPGTGQPDTTNAAVCTVIRQICHEPSKNWRGTDVS